MQNQIRTNELRIDLLRQQNESFKLSLEKLLSMNSNSSLVSEERYEEMRNQSRQEQSYRRYSFANEIVPSVRFSLQPYTFYFCMFRKQNKIHYGY